MGDEQNQDKYGGILHDPTTASLRAEVMNLPVPPHTQGMFNDWREAGRTWRKSQQSGEKERPGRLYAEAIRLLRANGDRHTPAKSFFAEHIHDDTLADTGVPPVLAAIYRTVHECDGKAEEVYSFATGSMPEGAVETLQRNPWFAVEWLKGVIGGDC